MATEHITRFYSLALGKYNNFSATTDGLIADGDLTPDVSLNSLLYTTRATTSTISDFDNGGEGQLVMVQNRGTACVYFNSSCVAANSGCIGPGQTITFKKNINKWYEVAKTGAVAEPFLIGAEVLADSNATLSVGAGGSAASLIIDMNTKVLVLTRTARCVFKSFSGGYEGQVIRIIKVLSCHAELGIGTGNLACATTASNIVMTASTNLVAMKYANQWHITQTGVFS
jgi:hypothetical protein